MMLWILVIFTCITAGNSEECISRSLGHNGNGCICNSTYCDFMEEQGPPEELTFHWYASDESGERMRYKKGYMDKLKTNGSIISLVRGKKHQTILGFGATITDSAAINIQSVSLPTQDNLIHSYFGEKGSRYSFGRVPIGGTDFSTRKYTLDDVNDDVTLKHFALADEDLYYKIPLLQKSALLNPNLKLIAVPWTAPKWMKITESFSGFGFLKPKHYQTFSNYLIKFLDEYSKFGMEFWGLSIGNDPQNALNPLSHQMTMAWSPAKAAKFIGQNLGPSINESSHNGTRILIFDDSLDYSISWYVRKIMKNKLAEPFVGGTAVHYHYTTITRKKVLDKIHKKYPNKYILMTEASELFRKKTCFGCWDQSINYILEMFAFLQHSVAGWINLNPVLNKDGGPNLSKYKYAPSIIVDAKNDQFFKLPLYYIIQHFSRFVPPGSVRIHTEINFQPLYDAIQVLAFETPQDETVVVVYNKNRLTYNVGITDENEGVINFSIKGFSLNTIIFKR
ncbi:lysosomal acid glucosylceramidase-like isoform X2 [Leptopilina heterotoma]|uniref:lysosomal acid glucosylceramidase-like isoform X2 n=1 Tax=Leptopilina heterotoma TaxID=63436 RepID=UPI001CA938E6|nr:lysosomal acid glucosylceramidase-like isoform X2 [Leptopilina heterotoma]